MRFFQAILSPASVVLLVAYYPTSSALTLRVSCKGLTQSTDECYALHHLEQVTPASEPRWNFEQYSFIADAPSWDWNWDAEQPCSEATQPVYQAYNGGFQRGEDSNHRYVVDPALLEPMVQEGWVDEGVVFCVPAQ